MTTKKCNLLVSKTNVCNSGAKQVTFNVLFQPSSSLHTVWIFAAVVHHSSADVPWGDYDIPPSSFNVPI